MRTELEIPDDIAEEVSARAALAGHEVSEEIVSLVKAGLVLQDIVSPPPPTEPRRPLVIETDPETGLPIICSPPNAPVYSMTPEQVLAMVHVTQMEEDLARVGLSLRQ
jgi:hypothetical protein